VGLNLKGPLFLPTRGEGLGKGISEICKSWKLDGGRVVV